MHTALVFHMVRFFIFFVSARICIIVLEHSEIRFITRPSPMTDTKVVTEISHSRLLLNTKQSYSSTVRPSLSLKPHALISINANRDCINIRTHQLLNRRGIYCPVKTCFGRRRYCLSISLPCVDD